MEYLSRSPEETKRVAAELAATLRGGELVLLEGDLGAGKTTFAQGLCEALGVQGPVRSPTFSVMNVHPTARGSVTQVVHADFYRFKDPAEALELGLEDWLGRSDTVTVAEWPARAGGHLSAARVVRVHFRSEGPEARRISVS